MVPVWALFLLLIPPMMTEDVKEYCGNIPADVVFVLDSSNSVHDVDFKKQLDFVSDVASMFQIGENMTQVGLLTFTERVHLNFFLNAYKTKASLIRGIKSTYKENGLGTRTDLALHFMRKRMFVPLTGARENVSRVAIIITDGKSEYPIKTLIESQIAKKQGIHIFTVGVGVAVNDDEMRRMASYPPDENAFTVKTYSFLDAIKNKLAVRTCTITTLPPSQTTTKRPTTEPSTTTTSTTTTTTTTTTSTTTEPTTHLITEPETTTPETTTTTTTTTTTPTTTELPTPLTTSRVDIIRKVCEMKTVDVVFALDSSTNISPMAFWHQVKFVRDVTVGLDIGFDRTRIGVVIYSDKVVSVFNVNDHETLNEALTKLYKIERTEGSTKIDEVIHYVRTKNFKRSVARKDVAQLMVLITGSSSKNLHKVKKEASMARKTGIEIMAIGVGRKYNPEELQVLAGLNSLDSNTDNKFAPFFEVGENTRRRKTFIVGSFSELDTIVTETAVELCTAEVSPIAIADQACGSRQEADMVFVMDSESAGRKNTQKVTDFMKTVANSVDLSSETIQMGMLQPDDCEPSVHSFKLDGDRDHLVSSLDGHDADKLPRLIRELRRHEFNAKNGARKDAKKIAIILIDGELAEPLKALREARRANLRGIEVFIIVVSKDPPQPEINSMCAYPPENHLFQVPDYDKLQDLQDSLIDMLCDEL